MQLPDKVTDEELENFLIKAEALVNARPLTEIPNHPSEPALTPNHFLFGNSNGDPGDEDEEDPETTEVIYERLLAEQSDHKRLLSHFWDRWAKEYLPLIAARSKWNKTTEPLQVGDLVFVCDANGWRRGMIEETFIDPETEQVREVTVRTPQKLYRRTATKIAKIKVD